MKLSTSRKSYVHLVSDWPKGTYKRRWGYIHDQVWFPVEKTDHELLDPEKTFKVFDYKRDFRWDRQWHQLYLDRRMLWLGPINFRFHTFHQGDDEAAPHDHPWWFITFPFRSYTETVMTEDGRMNSRVVRGWRFHYRPAKHRHFVHEPRRPFSTLIMTGRLKHNWSFWPDAETCIPHREWTNYNRTERKEP